MSKPLSPEVIAIVKRTAPIMQQHGLAITTRMYDRLFTDPKMKALFDNAGSAPGEQPKRLAAAILAYAQNVDNLSALHGAIERVAKRHVAAHIAPEHYGPVADALLPAIKDILGDAVDASILEAWKEAYWFLAEVLQNREKAIARP
ncbi:globin domain-containing protein [Robbsia sp. Bb-Pol-6]|uniref:Globin domain-containing protein n=1 Tax=Robbsia betulipollinis TaxID=2981849 RepID=A0ABT3ZRZ8_9BURK|nr:globin domain-containing protein [Robbsia betulipollinis]MCY0389329.1 globin domain-containing protein [Robbsia betulipollinis]